MVNAVTDVLQAFRKEVPLFLRQKGLLWTSRRDQGQPIRTNPSPVKLGRNATEMVKGLLLGLFLGILTQRARRGKTYIRRGLYVLVST